MRVDKQPNAGGEDATPAGADEGKSAWGTSGADAGGEGGLVCPLNTMPLLC